MLTEMLAQSRTPVFSVLQVETVADAVALLESRQFDVIIADLKLPDSHGLETALAVRNQAGRSPIIVLTAFGDEEDALQALHSDIQDYLLKGEITAPLLKRSIRYALQRQSDMHTQRQCEQRFSSFMEHLTISAWIKDMDGRYVFSKTGNDPLLVSTFPDYLGKTDEEVYPAETARRLRENDAEVLATGKSLQVVETLRLDDGVQHHFIVSKFPMSGTDGRAGGVGGIAMDITDRLMAEEALRRSEQKFAKVFHEVPALLAVSTEKEGRYLDVNDTTLRTLGYRREEMIGRSALELALWEDLSERDAVIKALEEKGAAKDIEVRLRGKHGQRMIGLFSAEYIDVEGERYILSLVKDITAMIEAQEMVERLNSQLAARTVDLEQVNRLLESRAAELEDANQELEAFNFTVAHDLRTPLNIIHGYCQMILEACGDSLDERHRMYLEQSFRATQRMNDLIATLLEFSRMGRSELHREAFDISALAGAVAAEVRLGEPEREVEFRIAQGITVDGDRALLRVVLHNLLGNAWKYTAKRATPIIEFGQTQIDGKTACFVRDNGPGFDLADAGKLFLPFQRLPGTAESKGFGVGLATVERIIRRHGGRIWAEGEPGRGAIFYFTIGAGGAV
jgi:PAS domain S-box-containing protein